MIHKLNLSPAIYTYLKDVVLLQAGLLCFAANCTSADAVTRGNCATYLNEQRHEPRFCGRGEMLASWYWEIEKKKSYLTRFAIYQPEEREQKRTWIARIAREMSELLDEEKKQLAISDFFDGTEACSCKKSETVRTWRGVASCFFLYFYEMYLGGNKKFPSELFPVKEAQPFGRQEFLDKFVKSNESLLMCPFCDAGRHLISVGNYIHGAIDHYLPKSLYPHLACHPCNLVPTCHDCNSTFKGSKDPLAPNGKRTSSFSRSLLPYASSGHEQLYLHVTFTKYEQDSVPDGIKSLKLQVRKESQNEQA